MKENNAAALFNLCFSRRQMFEFVRTHGKICNNKTISAFVSTMFHCHFFSSTLSLLLFIVGNIIAFHLFSPSLSLSIAIYLSHPLWFYHKMCFTFCHFNILLPLVVLPFSFCLWQRENCDEASWWDIVKTNAKKPHPPSPRPNGKHISTHLIFVNNGWGNLLSTNKTTCWIFIYFCSFVLFSLTLSSSLSPSLGSMCVFIPTKWE